MKFEILRAPDGRRWMRLEGSAILRPLTNSEPDKPKKRTP